MRFTVTTLALALMTFSAGITMEPAYAAGAGKEDSQKISSAAVSQRARFKFVKEYGSERELNAERYKNRGWIEKTGDGVFFYDGRGKVKKEIKRKLSSIENPIDERIDDRRFRRTYAEIFNDGLGALVREREYEVEGYDKIVPSTWTIYGPQGEIKGRFMDDINYLAAPNGRYFVGTFGTGGWLEGTLYFRDKVGEIVSEEKVFEWEGLNDRVVFSDDGCFGAYLYQGMEKGGFAVFNSTGGVIGRYVETGWDLIGLGEVWLDGVWKPLVRISPLHEVVLIAGRREHSGWVDAFGFDGRKLWSLEYNRSIDFEILNGKSTVAILSHSQKDSQLCKVATKIDPLVATKIDPPSLIF